MSPATPTVRRVVVAGGGIGGLSMAIALCRAGVEVVVLERAPQFSEAGSGLVLSPNGMKAVAALGADVDFDVRAAGKVYGAGHVSRFLTASGKPLAQVSFADSERTWDAPTMGILRSRLQDVLLKYAVNSGADVRTGAAVTGYTADPDTVVVSLSDGATVECDLLVGADGLRSVVRSALLRDGAPTYRGFTAVRGVAPAPESDPDGFIGYGRGTVLFAAAVGGGQVYWVASITAPPEVWPRKDIRTAHRDVLGLLDRWHSAAVGMVAASDPAACVLTDVYDRNPVSAWHDGRVVLLGDAAHPMVYTLGQGANTTMEDAVVLASHLRREERLDAALARYTADRAPRLATIVKQSRMIGTMSQLHNPIGIWLRNRMMTLMTRFGGVDRQNATVFGWQPPP
jgi:2-polyprenyl-6-methoxyphenol hydroxylase-like FAD-dependent oxidoreductase